MEVVRDVGSGPVPARGSVVTIGAYDGVHLGHRAVIGEVRRRAAELGCDATVVTFDRHPAAVVRPATAPRLLTDLEQKLELLEATGIDRCVVLTFDELRSHEAAEDFVRDVLVGALAARLVIVGEDFHFGHERSGDVALLQRMGGEHGFEVDGIELVASGSHRARSVSSTTIRAALAGGDLDDANRMLGRAHEVRGVVQQGDQRGRDLGYPTANVAVPDHIQLPADGIYAGWYERPDGSVHAAAVSLGRRPTFYEQQPYSLLEAHLLDFTGDLYGEQARVRFVRRLRGEERFDSVDDLVLQIGRDVERVRDVLQR